MDNRWLKTFISTTLIACFAPVYADGPFTVSKIEIQGLKRINEGTVLNYLPIQIGQTIQPSDTAKIIRVLYKTGFFSDVTLTHTGNTLIVKVVEKPTIGQFKITGNKSIPTKTLRKTLSDLGFAEGRIYDPSLLESIRDSLQREYYNRGNYNATVTARVSPESSNRVDINITVYEGPAAKISKISVIGNHAFKEKELLKQFSLSPTGLFSFLTDDDKFSQEKLNGDLEKLRSFYMDRGYAQFKVDSSEVLLSPDKKKVTILVHVTEGSKFTVSGYKLAGTFVEPKEKFERFIHFAPNEVFNRKKITDITQAMNNVMADDGYVYARVEPLPEVDVAKKQVFVTFLISPGSRYYVHQINFHGNDKTQDEVLRREMRQQEGAPYSLSKVKLSETRLNRLGYFKGVKADNTPLPGSSDEVNLDFNVTEAPSATMSMGLGYTNTLGWLVNAAYSQPNFLGTGKSVGANVQLAEGSQNVSLNYYNPYYTNDGIGRGFSAYADHYNTDENFTDNAAYQMSDYGLKMFFSFPISENDHLSAGMGYGVTLLNVGNQASDSVINFMDDYSLTLPLYRPESNNFEPVDPATGLPLEYPRHATIYNVNLTTAWGHSGFDRAVFPTRGYSHSLSATIAAPGGSDDNVSYYKLDYTGHVYQPLGKGFIASLRAEVGYGGGLFGTQYLPFYQNFGAGGIGVSGAVRGYQGFSIGPKTISPNNISTIGGNTLTVGSLELIIPTPLTPDSFRVTTFLDAGNVYNPNGAPLDPGLDSGPIRCSAGIQGQWQTPMGSLIFSLAKPLNEQPGDNTEVFQFSAGTSFL